MKRARARNSFLALMGLVLLLAGCQSLIAGRDEQAISNAVSLKAEAETLMDKATGDFESHRAEVEALRAKLEDAYDYAATTPRNQASARQWMVLKDPDRNLLGGFLAEWEEKGALSEVYVQEKKAQVADAFDTIIELERAKPEA